MAVRRIRNDDDDSGLDSLLDTMTNVVGILVLVLIVTQLSVADVVSKVIAETQVDATKLAQTKLELKQKIAEEQELERILVSPLDIDADRQREELQKNKELLERRQQLLEEKKQQQNEYAMKIDQQTKQAEAAAKIVEESRAKREQLETMLTSSLEQKAELEAKLSKTPRRVPPADIKVSIPNPRPAPEGVKEIPIVCVENRIYPMNVELFQQNAQAVAEGILKQFRIEKDPVKGIDPEQFTKHWIQFKDQDEYFDVEYFVQSDKYLRLRMSPRLGRGGSEKQVINSRSTVRAKYLNKIDPRQYFARFYVLPDSFDVYVTARRLFDKSEVLTGWDPQDQDWKYVSGVPGGIVLGPPVVPKPGAKPGPKPKPQNLID